MVRLRRLILVPVVGLALAAGCDTARPGLGVTNGPAPTAGEKPAMRTDLPTPDALGPDEATAAAAGSRRDAGAGVRGDGANDPARPPDAAEPADRDAEAVVPATPPAIEAPGDPGAQGATKPSGTINTGTPRSPH
jgi:hypothetical protein